MVLAYLGSKWKIVKIRTFENTELPTASVVIPFRNEAKNLPTLFKILDHQVDEGIEIIWVDDHSEDGSFQIVENLKKNSKGVHKLLRSNQIGKKAAIVLGVNSAGGEIILTTDADCIPPENWINLIRQFFLEPEVKFLAGPVMTVNEGGIFSTFQQIEWASILLVTQFGFAIGKSFTCSAANMAYRKSAFFAVEGYNGNLAVPSGDDEFLLKKIVDEFGKTSARYQSQEDLLMWTKPAQHVAELVNQRVRWASKWHVHKSWSHALAAVFAFAWQATFLLLIGIGFFSDTGLYALALLIGLKFSAELVFLGRVLKDFKIEFKQTEMFLTSLIHPLFVILIAFGTIAGKYTWKGRSN